MNDFLFFLALGAAFAAGYYFGFWAGANKAFDMIFRFVNQITVERPAAFSFHIAQNSAEELRKDG